MIKYGNRKVIVDNIAFDSKAEGEMYRDLKLLEKGNLIKNLELQPKFVLQRKFTNNNGEKIRAITYTADFRFFDVKKGRVRVIDCKGFKTKEYRIKKKLFDFIYSDLFLEEHY